MKGMTGRGAEVAAGGKGTEALRAVGYVRVSTPRQGERGISLSAQEAAIRTFAGCMGWDVIDIFHDVHTGAGPDSFIERKNLLEALKLAQAENAYVVTDNWARLTRHENTSADIKRLFPDTDRLVSIKEANTFTEAARLGQIARAEAERNEISRRTKAGFARLKDQGVRFGNPNIQEAQVKGAQAITEKADAIVRQIADVLRSQERHHSQLTCREVAELLNQKGVRTGQNLEWTTDRLHPKLRKARAILDAEQVSYTDDPLYGAF
ncbi:recombinase family protein [Cereibacter sphaeroides]|uniref:recombinase family protein n=1 Tax=Cereibacter sphaeroides TaxID=1063 RepID=UPI001F1EAB1C|nr:recombinase family protein [Cereibacter sphaeroides]MCE6967470.1 recombinase family protein [Cereibacter sphaeroides]